MKKNYRKTNFWIFYVSDRLSGDFVVDEFGWHKAPSGYIFEERRKNHLIEMVFCGTCHLTVWEGGVQKNFVVKEGEAFIIPAGVKHSYRSDEEDPSSRYWLSFSGARSEEVLKRIGFVQGQYVYTGLNVNEMEKRMEKFRLLTNDRPETIFSIYSSAYSVLGMFGRLNSIPAEETEGNQKRKLFIESVAGYVEKNLSRRIGVEELADSFGYERSHFYRLFRAEMHVSVQQYVTNRRIVRARSLLSETDKSLARVAEECGYENYSSFSKAFTGNVGISPSEYREQHKK